MLSIRHEDSKVKARMRGHACVVASGPSALPGLRHLARMGRDPLPPQSSMDVLSYPERVCLIVSELSLPSLGLRVGRFAAFRRTMWSVRFSTFEAQRGFLNGRDC